MSSFETGEISLLIAIPPKNFTNKSPRLLRNDGWQFLKPADRRSHYNSKKCSFLSNLELLWSGLGEMVTFS